MLVFFRIQLQRSRIDAVAQPGGPWAVRKDVAKMRAALAASPPPLVKGKRLKLFYAAQSSGSKDGKRGPNRLGSPEFVLFVNDVRLLARTYARYLEARIRKHAPYPGLPITLTLRPRSQKL